MNKNGQSLILFVLILPLFLVACAYLFDSAIITYENKNLDHIAQIAFEYQHEGKDYETIIDYIKENNKNIEVVTLNEKEINLKLDIKSYFGQIIGYDSYHLESNIIE